MKNNLVSLSAFAAAFALASSAAFASEGMLLCHVVGVDNTINNTYYVNGPAEAERKYVEAHALAYDLQSVSWTDGGAYHPNDFVAFVQSRIGDAFFDAQRGVEEVQGSVGGAFIYDIDLSESRDGSTAGRYVRRLLPGMVTCTLIQPDS